MKCRCVNRMKVCWVFGLVSATVGQSHPVLLPLLLESQCQSEKRVINERVQPPGGK